MCTRLVDLFGGGVLPILSIRVCNMALHHAMPSQIDQAVLAPILFFVELSHVELLPPSPDKLETFGRFSHDKR